ncbi:MAG TPA: hypothetical protein VLV29_02070 [Steroidobacteraceae bacterium]|nr:hypothetical protein [Steroidobacteraceae bacterium]
MGVFLAAAPQADETHWRDIESRIQYGYYTEDSRALHNLEEALEQDEAHEALRGYYAGLVAWRLALLTTQNAPAGGREAAAQLAARCVKALDGVLATQADFAEGLALRAACQEPPVAGGGLHLPFAGHSARKDIERALALAPRNPRVLLIEAAGDYQLPAAQGGNRERALVKLRQAVATFELERGGPEPLPGWGAAEAYLFLARDLMDHGDAVGARDALERALLAAPDYRQARRLMAKIAAG